MVEVTEVKCALASMGFINEDLQYNKTVIIDTMKVYSAKADIVLFGEAFLQEFYGATFHVKQDMQRVGIDSFKKIYAGEESIDKYLYDGFEKAAIQNLISQVES